MGKPSIELNFRRQISREHEQIIAQVRPQRAVSHSSLPLRCLCDDSRCSVMIICSASRQLDPPSYHCVAIAIAQSFRAP